MKDEQLMQYSPEQARQQLADDQLERYNELQEEKLAGDIQEEKQQDAENAVNGLEAMRRQAEGDLTVEVYGIEFIADLNPRQIKKLKKLEKFENKKPEELNDKQFDDVHKNFLELLAELSVNHDLEDWKENFGDAGVMTLGQITGNLLSKVDVQVEEKKRR